MAAVAAGLSCNRCAGTPPPPAPPLPPGSSGRSRAAGRRANAPLPPNPRCGKPSKLLCPKCVALKLPREKAAFCSQDCFKAAWSTHKQAHKPAGGKDAWMYCIRRGQGRSTVMPRFGWTGELRPRLIGPARSVPAHIPRPDYAESGYPKEEQESPQQRQTKIRDKAAVAGMRHVCRMAREIIDEAHKIVKPGVTADEIDRVVHDATVERNAYPAPLNYFNFPKSVCTSPNEVICHGIPDQRELEDGDIVNVDVTAIIDGYYGDLNETYTVGDNVSDEAKHLVKSAYECLFKAIDKVKPDAKFRDLGAVISSHAHKAGLSVVKSYCGHGIGDLFHCAPQIPHYTPNKAIGRMKPGMTFTIEPMINMGSHKDVTWPDGWTAVTADGSWSAQFEHTLLVTDKGCDILTARLPDSPPLFWEKE